MSRRALLVCPGRGAYTPKDLGTLAARREQHGAQETVDQIVGAADAWRDAIGSRTITDLDRAERFTATAHMAGPNAGPLIYTCTAVDHALLPAHYRPVAVAGNSMGWYTALHVGGSVDFESGLAIVDGMSKSTRGQSIGGQCIAPWVDDDWVPREDLRARITNAIATVRDAGHPIHVSIELGGFLVVAGTEEALAAFEGTLPSRRFGSRNYPFRLTHHSAFHTDLMGDASRHGLATLGGVPCGPPAIPMIDGRGRAWRALGFDRDALVHYTFVTQVLQTYRFTTSLRHALREYAPDVVVLLGPGDSLGGAIGQAMIQEGWRGVRNKADFLERQATDEPLLISMGRAEQFERFIAPHL